MERKLRVPVFRSKSKVGLIRNISVPIRNLVHSDCGYEVVLEIVSSKWMR